MIDNIKEILSFIDPSKCNYIEWTNVGMALKHEGYSADVWDEWSSKDAARYHAGECFTKWNTFNETTGNIITGGTLIKMAQDNGYFHSEGGHELGWDDVIQKDDLVIVDKGWIEGVEIKEPIDWNPVNDLITYLETLFDSEENVGYVTRSFERDGRFMPTKGCWDRTAGQLIDALTKCNGDIGSVLGDYNPDVGAWIRFNPLNGKGIKNDNVTDYRFALVESDSMELEKQNAILHELELPIACLVFSGKKSIHAIVKIDATSYPEYIKRVEFLYKVCEKNGLEIDKANKNPSRLSRMPGVTRNGHKQFLIDTNIGKSSWNEWAEWIESVNDDLPEPESLETYFNNLPELSPSLIDGILRQGHKMLLAGPSKAGKSFALIELCIAIAEEKEWFGFKCSKGKVLYVNLELDRASCLHRFKDVYQALNIRPNNLSNIDIWNLRGKSIPMDKLAPKLIRRALKKDYIAIIIDPIYKVITGDENSADQMAQFCNQFDKICTGLGTAVIYCHHHSKGAQGSKRSMDRASGSGVFARDPDALLDLIELNLSDEIIRQEKNKAKCKICLKLIEKRIPEYKSELSKDDMLSAHALTEYCNDKLDSMDLKYLNTLIKENEKKIDNTSAWRIEATLREFPKLNPINLWFDYPIHRADESGSLGDLNPDDDNSKTPWKNNLSKKKTPEEQKEERIKAVEVAYETCKIDENVTVKSIAEYLGVSEKTARRRILEAKKYEINDGTVLEKP